MWAAVIVAVLASLGLAITTQKAELRDDYAPESGALFGGAVNLNSQRDDDVSGNPRDVMTRQNQLCRKYDNLHYYLFGLAVGPDQLTNIRWAIDENATPVVTVSWPQRMPTNPNFIPEVAAGKYDSQIATTAERLKALGGHIILRPYWEFNHAETGLGAANYGGDYGLFIKAWQRTHTIFLGDPSSWLALGIRGTPVQAENIRFSWTPGSARPTQNTDGVSEDYRPYYPGDQYVDWIGIDSYTGFRMIFLKEIFMPPTQLVDWYATYQSKGKPMTISEVGIKPQSTYPNRSPSRVEWFIDARAALKQMPMVKLFSYFDVSNERFVLAESYQVDAPGGDGADSADRVLEAYSALANDPYFRHSADATLCGGGKESDGATESVPVRPTSERLCLVSRPQTLPRRQR